MWTKRKKGKECATEPDQRVGGRKEETSRGTSGQVARKKNRRKSLELIGKGKQRTRPQKSSQFLPERPVNNLGEEKGKKECGEKKKGVHQERSNTQTGL